MCYGSYNVTRHSNTMYAYYDKKCSENKFHVIFDALLTKL